MDEQTTARVIQGLRRLSIDEVRHSVIQSMTSDTELAIQRQTLSLRCPLSQARIRDPCRFSGCSHFQCFDATYFLLFTHATQLRSDTINLRCPICERDVTAEALVLDLYFDNILRHAPVIIDEVYLQADGEWRTRDITPLREAAPSVNSHSHAPHNPRKTFRPSNARPDMGHLHPEPEVIYIDSTSSLHETIVGEPSTNEKDDTRLPGDPHPPYPEPSAWGAHFRSTATAIYGSFPPLNVPPFPPSPNFWNADYPGVTHQTTSSREDLPGQIPPFVPPGPQITGAPLTRPPPAYQPPRVATEMSQVVRNSGSDPRADIYHQEAQLEPPTPTEPDRERLSVQESTGGIYRCLKSLGFIWCLWILMVLVDLIEGIITIRLSIMMTQHHDFNQLDLGNRIRFVCFTSWWTMTGLLAAVPIEIAWTGVEPSRGAALTIVAVFLLTWIFWTAGAGSISTIIWPREGPDCIIENFPYCKYSQGVLGLAWLMWITVTIQGACLVCRAYKKYEAAQHVV